MLCSARSVPLRLLCQVIVKQNLLVTITVAPVSSFGSSTGTANEYEKFTVTNLKEKAEKYLKQTVPDTAQSSEKTSMAAKRALKDYVEKLQAIHQVEIVPSNIESPWTSGTLERLVRLIKKKMVDKKKLEFTAGWSSAFE
uniref:Uncharacterized protein n=1 Tax=Acrobeloides nanus TaxID=290746 RepID=A0A914CPB2_9BILA